MASKSSAPAKNSVAPNQTLYIRNLPDKLPKPDLKRELYLLFSTYGSVLDIVALKTLKMRGQAFVTYKDIQTAAQAMRNLEGYEFYGNSMTIAYAKSKSNFVSKLDGTFALPTMKEQRPTDATDIQTGDKPSALQQSVFSGAPASKSAPAPGQSQSLKRARDDEDEEEEEEEEDDDVEMEIDESDDD